LALPKKERRPALVQIILGTILDFLVYPIIFAEAYAAFPANITVGINEPATLQIGNIDPGTGTIEPMEKPFFLYDRILYFSAEVLGDGPSNVWFINFDPPSMNASKLPVTNVTISLTSPPMATEPIQNTIIRIHIADTWITGNMWFAKKSDFKEGEEPSFIFRVTWPLAAFTGGFGKLSGKILVEPYYVDVLVTVKPFHAAKIQALPPKKLSPSQTTSIPILIENQGNYNDTFNFRIRTETGHPITVTRNGTITLQPGEQGQAFIGVALPKNILDTGTLHSLFIEVYSANQPNVSIATQRVFIESQGLYITQENTVYSIGFGLFFLIIIGVFLNLRQKSSRKNGKKPKKPWKIPEEQQHLKELKRTDNVAYEHERLMMEDEYKSALLWYKNDSKIPRKERKRDKQKKPISNTVKKLINLPKKIQKTKKKQKKPKKKPKEKPKKQLIKPLAPKEETSKEQVLSKIKKEQEKQLRRLK
jgi:hypothetical protein